MKVVLAEFDKGLMMKRKGKIIFRNVSKNLSWKDFRGGRRVPKISGKSFEGRTDSSENILEGIWGADGREIDWDL